MQRSRSLLSKVGAAACGLLLVAACGGSAEPASTSAAASATTEAVPEASTAPDTAVVSETTTLPSSTAASEASVAATLIPADPGLSMVIEIADGRVTPEPGRLAVPLDSYLTITVVADVVDEVHLHGYDVHFDVAPEQPAIISMSADIPGLFEIELEGSGLLLTELEVR